MDKLEKLTVPQLKKLIVDYNLHNVIKPYSKMRKHELIAAIRHHNTFLNNVMTNKQHSINVPQKVIKKWPHQKNELEKLPSLKLKKKMRQKKRLKKKMKQKK